MAGNHNANDIHNELDTILENDSNDHDKKVIYNELLNKLIALNKATISTNNNTDEKTFEPEVIIQSLLPTKSLIKKALTLLNYFKQTQQLTWDLKGEVSIHGNKLGGSNIIDLIQATLRKPTNKSSVPLGFMAYKEWLRNSATPIALIGNKDLRPNLNQTLATENEKHSVDPIATPIKNKLRSNKTQLQWQKY